MNKFKIKKAVALVKNVLFTGSILGISCSAFSADDIKPVKNIIIMIPDGMSVSGTTLTRLYNGAPLTLDPLAVGLMSTWSSDGTIADSAPAGSAISTGWKSQSGNIASTGKVYSLSSTRSSDEALRPVATILEAARLKGKAIGVVSTSEFMHATPADFTAHDPSRKSYDNLTEQMVYNHLDVILGGGTKYLRADIRKDNEDMKEILIKKGYSFVDSTEALKNFEGKRLVGVFGKTPEHTAISNDIDRDSRLEPALEEMTDVAIKTLSKDEDGFVLMIEGSKIDWSAHANDPIGMISEIAAFDKAVAKALTYAKADGNTLLISVSDHGNSGISIGNRDTSENYDKTSWTEFVTPLKAALVTGEGFEEKLPANREGGSVETMGNEVRRLAQEWLGVTDLTNQEIESILKAKKGQINYAVGPILAKRAKIGFTTNGHTGEDTVLYSYDPRGTLLKGLVDNTDVAKFMARSIDVDLDKATETLFVDAQSAFLEKKATIILDESDAENPVLVVTKNNQTLRIPRNKSEVWLNDTMVESDGVNVFNGEKWFVSSKVISLIN
ncbi:alkaline phosphatase [Thorsellia kenyensis]|uniref:Alkaline phosphatase n=1 Tax=Thorsellia kenyensis TaxID=1549888 RepID=A0ABV6CC61_9GAMM